MIKFFVKLVLHHCFSFKRQLCDTLNIDFIQKYLIFWNYFAQISEFYNTVTEYHPNQLSNA